MILKGGLLAAELNTDHVSFLFILCFHSLVFSLF